MGRDNNLEAIGRTLIGFVFAAASRILPMKVVIVNNTSNSKSHQQQQIDSGIYLRPSKLSNPRARVIYLLMVAVIVFCWLNWLVGRHWEYQFEQWQPQVRLGAQRNGSCLIGSDILPNKPLEQALALKQLIGPSFVAKFDSFASWELLGTAAGASLLLVFCYLQKDCLRIVSLSFIINPRAERALARRRLAKISRQLVSGEDFVEQVASWFCSCSQHPICLIKTGNNKLSSCLIKRQMRADLMRYINDQLPHLREPLPACFQIKTVGSYYRTAIILYLWYTMMIPLSGTVFVLQASYYQMQVRLSERLAKAQCELWHPDGQLMKHRLQFDSEDTTRSWRDNKHLYQNLPTVDSSRHDLLCRELKLLLTSYHFLIYLLCHALFAVAYFIWFVLYRIIYGCDLRFYVTWLDDVGNQLEQLQTKLIQLDEESNRVHLSNLLETTASSCQKKQQQQHLHRPDLNLAAVHSGFVASYLNFELFREYFRQSKRVNNFVASASVLVYVCIILWTLLSFDPTSSNKKYMLLLASACLMLINAICISSSLILTRVRRISAKLLGCLALATDLSIELSSIVSLWRRQFIRDEEIGSYYSLTLFGVELSRENLIWINSNLFGLAMIIYQRNYANN